VSIYVQETVVQDPPLVFGQEAGEEGQDRVLRCGSEPLQADPAQHGIHWFLPSSQNDRFLQAMVRWQVVPRLLKACAAEGVVHHSLDRVVQVPGQQKPTRRPASRCAEEETLGRCWRHFAPFPLLEDGQA
jgi:hypothetical protein